MDIANYFKLIVSPLLRHPDELKVVTTQDAMGVLLTVDVNKDDMGIIVGKGGETAKALRHLVRIAGTVHDARVRVKISEPVGSTFYKDKK